MHIRFTAVPRGEWTRATVEGVVSLELPAGRFSAFQISVEQLLDPFEPGEFWRFWYGRSGFLGYHSRRFGEVRDASGAVIARYEVDWLVELTSLSLVGTVRDPG